jgi:hypothetical protein
VEPAARRHGPAGFVLTEAAGTHYLVADGCIRVEHWELVAEEIGRFCTWAEAAAEIWQQAACGVSLKVLLSQWPCLGSDTETPQSPRRRRREHGTT